jgi:hypothetical protein
MPRKNSACEAGEMGAWDLFRPKVVPFDPTGDSLARRDFILFR